MSRARAARALARTRARATSTGSSSGRSTVTASCAASAFAAATLASPSAAALSARRAQGQAQVVGVGRRLVAVPVGHRLGSDVLVVVAIGPPQHPAGDPVAGAFPTCEGDGGAEGSCHADYDALLQPWLLRDP